MKTRAPFGPGALVALAAALGLLGSAGAARAQRSSDVHLFAPTIDSYGFFAVERAETQPAWTFGFKLTLDYAQAPLSAVMSDAGLATRQRRTLIDWQAIAHLGLSAGITSWLGALVELPVSAQSFGKAYGSPLAFDDATLTRSGFYAADPWTTSAPPNAGPLDLRLGVKARAWRNRFAGLGLVALMTVPLGDDHAFLGDSGVTFRPTAIGDFTLGHLELGLNAGAVVRGTTRVLDPAEQAAGVAAPHVLFAVGHELSWGAAVGYRFVRWLGAAAEVTGLEPLTERGAGRDRTVEVQGGLRFWPTAHLGAFVGAGGNLTPDAARHERFRVFAGLTWVLATSRAEAPRALAEAGAPGDRDGDGIPDATDRCPGEPEDRDGFQDSDGCPDLDNDGDGLPDRLDHCPDEPEDKDGFEDADGCPDLDNDGDDIPDAADRCPNEPETRNGVDDADGCPDSGGLAAADLVLPTLGFEPGRSTLDTAAEGALEHVADKLLATSLLRRVRIEGHADAHEAAAAALSQARALAVRDFLVKRGVDGARLQAVGYGATRPRDTRAGAAAHASNRRVELIVVEQ